MKATREQVLAMAREAGATQVNPHAFVISMSELERFAHLMQRFERDRLRAQDDMRWVFSSISCNEPKAYYRIEEEEV